MFVIGRDILERKAQRQANENIQPWQRDIKPGDCFIRQSKSAPGVDIYCETLKPEPEDDEDETVEMMPEYRLVRAFSRYCPKGELGEVHISTATRMITSEELEKAVKGLE